MKKIVTVFGAILFALLTNFCYSQNLPVVNKNDKSFSLYPSKFDDTPLTYGYKSPELTSEKIICFSSFTDDVENNPHKCLIGAYYSTYDLNIEYITTENNFVKLKFKEEGKQDIMFYVEKKYIIFE